MSERKDKRKDSSPYGPHPAKIDEVSGGADSSPFETIPSGEKAPDAEGEWQARRPEPHPGGRAQDPAG